MKLRPLQTIVAIFVIAFALAGCGEPTDGYRWKLTIAMNTPDGVKRASSVSQISFFDVSISARGVMHRVLGEALYLDLGPNARPLIALMTNTLYGPYTKETERLNRMGARWSDETGPNHYLLLRLYGMSPSPGRDTDFRVDVRRLASMRGARPIAASDLPDLVTFADIDDPATVIRVDPNNLEATLGKGISWNEITLEITDEPITKGIKQKLSWLSDYARDNLKLSGARYGYRARPVVSDLQSWNFFQDR